MIEKLAGIHYWMTIIALILAGIIIAAPFVMLAIVKIKDGVDIVRGKIRRQMERKNKKEGD